MNREKRGEKTPVRLQYQTIVDTKHIFFFFTEIKFITLHYFSND